MRLPRPARLDAAIAAVLVTWAVVEAIVVTGPGPTWERIAWGLALTVPLAWSRFAPIPIALGLAALSAVHIAIDQSATREGGATPFPSLLVAAFAAAAYARRVRDAVLAGAVITGVLAWVVYSNYYTGSAQPSDAPILVGFVGAAWGVGYLVRRRTQSGEQAVAEERARIARELHDIVGHSVSVISLQAGAAEQLLRKDPDAAAEHLQAVRRTAHEALVEMRRLLAVLREDAPTYDPQPGLDRLDALVAQARAGGLTVEVERADTDAPLAPGVDLAAYRIVQEALTNARKHAGAVHARVRVTRDPQTLDIEVVNDGPPVHVNGSGGHGLAGMAERVRLFGGTLDAAPRADGGFRVHARLPA